MARTKRSKSEPQTPLDSFTTAEHRRLDEDRTRTGNWKRWGPYLSERQWGTVREDYSADGDCWNYLPHDHARSRAYRWGEDGLLGITDRECRLCFALALWNGRDPVLKERLFGVTNPEGNHGEDVKEDYFYLDSTPTHSYMRALYKYPQSEFPYARIVEENRRRDRGDREFEIGDTNVFDGGRYFDVFAEYAKDSPDDILIRLTIHNRADEPAPLHLLPTLWFRNTWNWGRTGEGYLSEPPAITAIDDSTIEAAHPTLGVFRLSADARSSAPAPRLIFTDNETNIERLFDAPNTSGFVKDAFHDYVIGGARDKVNPARRGTKAAFHYEFVVPAHGSTIVRLRLRHKPDAVDSLDAPFANFDETFGVREQEAAEFYRAILPENLNEERRAIVKQAYAGLLWSKQFYHYAVREWIEGDPSQPPPPPARHARHSGRNAEWRHLFNRDVVSVPDKWEYPWYAAWDLAFHMLPLAQVDPDFAKNQLILFLREWYMHPNGQMPAYEFAFSDVNPPVHAWAAWRVYKITAENGNRDRSFLERVFQKLLINFTWWVNRKDAEGNNIFSGGFLGLDNIGVFDRSQPLPSGSQLEQADGTAWMGFYCLTMLSMALELAREDPVYEDIASKFFEHFIGIVDAINNLGETGLWNEADGFYYDEITTDNRPTPLRVRSMVGIIPLFAVEVLDEDLIGRLPGFAKRLRWFVENRQDLAHHIAYFAGDGCVPGRRLLAIPSEERLRRVLGYLLDESEFLADHGVRSLSRFHLGQPYAFPLGGREFRIGYEPGESESQLFGGNSNWRGPIWFPVNYLLIESLERYHYFYGDRFKVECPAGSGVMMTLAEVARELSRRLATLFTSGEDGRAAWQGDDDRFARDPHWRGLTLFHEYFDGDTGRGLGASHQTGWTALVARLIEDAAK